MRGLVGCLFLVWACGGSDGPSGPSTTGGVGTVRGSVLAAADSGVQGVSITLQRSGQSNRTATTDAGGRYTVANLATGRWTVSATPIGGYEADGSLTASVDVGEGQTVDAPVLRLRRSTAPALATVAITNNQFTPQTVTVAVNGTVRWTNNGSVQHNSTAAGQWASPNLGSGGTFERTFPAAGTFAYECTLHAGMTGTVVVQ